MQPVLGIDLGGTTVNWVVRAGSAENRAVVARGSVPTASDRTAIVAGLVDIVWRVETEHDVLAVGVGVPGHVDRTGGVVRFLPNLPGDWAGYPLGPELTRETGKPVHLLNDARAFCLAELTLGAAYGRSDALFLTLGTGVGGGVVMNGRLLVGPDDRLGEIGHLTYQRDGRPCGCGNRGCLETYASGPALVAAAEELGGRRPASAAEELSGRRPNSPADVLTAAESGDEAARTVVEGAGRAIGETIASLCTVLPADVLVIGGGVAAGLPQLRPHIERALARRRSFVGSVDVVPARLGTMAGAIGAALAAEPENAAATVAANGGDRELDPASA